MTLYTDNLILGAGLTGLTTAFYLNKHNQKFVLLEKTNRYGGVIKTITENEFVYETGPNTGVLATQETAELFEDLDCEIITANDNVKKRYILKNNCWHALPSGILSAIGTPLFDFKDKIKILAEPFRKPGQNPEETLAQLVLRRMGKTFLDYAIDPFILGVYAGDPNLLITKYAFPKLYNLEQKYGSFIKGQLKKSKEHKTERDKKATRKVFSAKNCLQTFIDNIYLNIKSQNIFFNTQDIKIYNLSDTNNENQRFKIIFASDNQKYEIVTKNLITTTPSNTLKDILIFNELQTFEKIEKLKYAKVAQITIGFKDWKGIKLDGFGGLIPFCENKNILGALYMSSLFDNRAPKNGALLSVFTGGIRREDIYNLNDNQLIDSTAKDFMQLFKLNDFNPDILKINRYQNAIPQYSYESHDKINAINFLQNKYSGLYIAGNIADGIGMADRIKQAKNIVNIIILKNNL